MGVVMAKFICKEFTAIHGFCRQLSILGARFNGNESMQKARESHVYSYTNGFRGFAAKLTEEQASKMVEMRPWHFWRRHGTKRFNVDKNPIDVFWDLKNAKFSNEPEPISDFYVAVICNDKVVLLLGDQKHDAFRRTGSRPSIFDAILICKKEHVFGKRKFTTRARLDEKGKLDNEICVEINGGLVDSDMVIKIDGNVGVEIKHLQWKFRGHDCVNVERVKVEVYWDVHDWLFSSSNGLRHALFIFKPMTSSSSLSSTTLDQGDAISVDNGGLADGSSDLLLVLVCLEA